jgi:hypothetical protein
MTTATANSAAAGSDSASQTLSLDDAAGLDFHDPEEQQDNVGNVWRPNVDENKDDSASLEKVAETMSDDNEGDEPATEEVEANEADKPEETADPDAAPILLKGGEQVTLGELKLGYMRDKDYRHKTTAVATARKSLEFHAARVLKTVDAVAGFLANQLPEEPSYELAMTNPPEYTRRKAMWDAGIGQVNAILALATDPKAVQGEVKKEVTEEDMARENAALIDAMPELAKPDVREKFFADAFKTAEEFGYSPEELQSRTDHRDFIVMHWAMKGIAAEKAKQDAEIAKKAALQKVNNAPPIVAKAKPAAPQGKSAGNRDAMRKLSNTGHIRDALNVDF